MEDKREENILVWLPTPMGDAILCTPAIKAIRQHYKSSKISFFARPAVREILSPGGFNDVWLEQQSSNPFTIAKTLKKHNFSRAILFKNSFGCALASFLAGIPLRIGYARDGRGFLLTDKLYPRKEPNGKFKPIPMIDYYLAIASWVGADTGDRSLEILVDSQDSEKLKSELPEVFKSEGPMVVLVPGGAFGPSKCWPAERFAETADWLVSNYDATVAVSVSPAPAEVEIARQICDASRHKLLNLAERPLSLGRLKALFAEADLVISNDTGPRHIAIAMGRKIISLFGPNDPTWTQTGSENEIQLVGDAPCAPCAKPKCQQNEHLCMQSITTEMVCGAAKKLLEKNQRKTDSKPQQKFTEISESFFVDADFQQSLSELGLTSIEAVFSFNAGKELVKDNLADYRSRTQFEIGTPPRTVFLKRYKLPPVLVQLKSRLCNHRWASCASLEFEPAKELAKAGINTPRTIAYAEQRGVLFEKRSFIITEKIPEAESIERKLPDYFNKPVTAENLKKRRDFIARLANFVKRFHETNYRHRDLYFSHIFYSNDNKFYLIDLARAFKPGVLGERFRAKDIAQLYYSAPGEFFSGTDRLRFYLTYTGESKLSRKDKVFISKVKRKVKRMARHDVKHGRSAPFAG